MSTGESTGPAPAACPAAEGYRLPAEWEPHAATWLAWPHERADWPGKFGPIPWVFVEVTRLLTQGERVEILVQGARAEARARDRLERSGVDLDRVGFHRVPTDRCWTRDSFPTFLVRPGAPSPVAVDWAFNGWAKYENHRRDDRIGRRLAGPRGWRRWVPRNAKERRVVLEGGAIDYNGLGCLMATEECLLSPVQERNPGMSREDYEAILAEALGIRRVIWLGRGIVGDDTHGHVDDVSRFVGPGTVVTAIERDPSDANYEPLRENERRLRAACDQDGRPLEVVTLPMPRPVTFEGVRLPASYANFYIGNACVVVPVFNDPADHAAVSTLRALFPDREVIGVPARDLVWGLGTFHCMTHEEPAAV